MKKEEEKITQLEEKIIEKKLISKLKLEAGSTDPIKENFFKFRMLKKEIKPKDLL